MKNIARTILGVALLSLVVAPANAQSPDSAAAQRARECPSCAEWNAPHAPVKLFGNTWFVGTNGLSAILVTSPSGHVLLDGALPESAAQIMANIRTLGFRVEDVKLIVNSHAHFDHSGGIAALQKASGARVVATEASARAIRSGAPQRDDPQFGVLLAAPAVPSVEVINDGDTMHVGTLALVAHRTGGHTPGGTTWTWRSCDGERCADIVYADSFTPISADDFFYTKSTTYPNGIADFARSFAVLDGLRCDMLITPHPSASRLWERLAERDAGNAEALLAPGQCAAYAARGRAAVAARVAKEQGGSR